MLTHQDGNGGSKPTTLEERDGQLCVRITSVAQNYDHELTSNSLFLVSAVFLSAVPLLLSVYHVLTTEESSDIDVGFKFVMSALTFGLCLAVTLVSFFGWRSYHGRRTNASEFCLAVYRVGFAYS